MRCKGTIFTLYTATLGEKHLLTELVILYCTKWVRALNKSQRENQTSNGRHSWQLALGGAEPRRRLLFSNTRVPEVLPSARPPRGMLLGSQEQSTEK